MLKKSILIACLLFASLSACDDEIASPIPYAPVNLVLHLNGEDSRLNGSLSFIEYTRPRTETDRLGFGGILVINGLGEGTINLFAYDLACPNEADRNVRIRPQDTGLRAICPKCNAVYNIANGWGSPESGSKHRLKRYNVFPISETQYRVVN